MTATESWVDIAEVAARLQGTNDPINRRVDSKSFPAHRVGRLRRFKLLEVDGWVRSGRDEHVPSEGERRSTNDN